LSSSMSWLGLVAGWGQESIRIVAPDKSAPQPKISAPARPNLDTSGRTARDLFSGNNAGDAGDALSLTPSGPRSLDAKSQKLILDALTKKKNERFKFEDRKPNSETSDFVRSYSGSDVRGAEDTTGTETDSSGANNRSDKDSLRTGNRNPARNRDGELDRGRNRDDDRYSDRDRDARDRDGKPGARKLPSFTDSPLSPDSDSNTKGPFGSTRLNSGLKSERIRTDDSNDFRSQFDGDRDFGPSLGSKSKEMLGIDDPKSEARQANFNQLLGGSTAGSVTAPKSLYPNTPGGAGADRSARFGALLGGSAAKSSSSSLPPGAVVVDPSRGTFPDTSLANRSLNPISALAPSGGALGSSPILPSGPLLTPNPSLSAPVGIKSQPAILPIPRRF
jgi:hypothetical protein